MTDGTSRLAPEMIDELRKTIVINLRKGRVRGIVFDDTNRYV